MSAESAPHGSPARYAEGCRSAGGCENHGSDVMLTCVAAFYAHRSDYALQKQPLDQPITHASRVIPKAPRRAAVIPPPKPAPRSQTRTTAPALRAQAPAGPRLVASSNHGSITGYYVDGCQDSAACPADPSCAAVASGAEWIRNAPGRRHGTLTGFWIDDCDDPSTCPARPSCSEVAGGAPGLARPVSRYVPEAAPQAARSTRGPQAKTERKTGPREEVHGTVHGFRRGCKTDEDCPNTAVGKPSCGQASRAYYRDYIAAAKAGNGPEIKHGSVTGYQLGCSSRTECPGGADGTTCIDAANDADRQRRRAAGRPERPPLVDSAPVRAHVEQLRLKGMGLVRIAEAAGVSKTSIRSLVYGRDDYLPDGTHGPRHGKIPQRVNEANAEKILAVQPQARVSKTTAVHGTRNGHRALECGPDDPCPSKADGGISCHQASVEYQRSLKASKLSTPEHALEHAIAS